MCGIVACDFSQMLLSLWFTHASLPFKDWGLALRFLRSTLEAHIWFFLSWNVTRCLPEIIVTWRLGLLCFDNGALRHILLKEFAHSASLLYTFVIRYTKSLCEESEKISPSKIELNTSDNIREVRIFLK